MEQHTITAYYASDKSKQGKEYTTKDGKPYKRVAIQTDLLPPGVWASTNAFRPDDPVLMLQKGQKVMLKVYQEGEWWNFRVPSRLDLMDERVVKLEERVFGAQENKEVNKPAEDLPF